MFDLERVPVDDAVADAEFRIRSAAGVDEAVTSSGATAREAIDGVTEGASSVGIGDVLPLLEGRIGALDMV